MLAWGTGLALYIICWICMPRADRVLEAQRGRVLGVCFRLSRALNVDVAIVRILALFAALGSLGTFLIIYVILHFVIPKDSSNKLMNV
jgi:phage shock protein PspC (stress-responsive transcriptional regulator)